MGRLTKLLNFLRFKVGADLRSFELPVPEWIRILMKFHLPDIDRITIYRNIEKLIALDLIQELHLPKTGKAYQFIFDRKVHHYYRKKSCPHEWASGVSASNEESKALENAAVR